MRCSSCRWEGVCTEYVRLMRPGAEDRAKTVEGTVTVYLVSVMLGETFALDGTITLVFVTFASPLLANKGVARLSSTFYTRSSGIPTPT